MAKEAREFKLHKDILWSIILAQSGTLSKGLLELLCNSVDAGATRVDIELTRDSISVLDDGKGFTSRTEIEQFFETFGTPHTAGDATYGRFRMGRGQIMAFTVNTWESGRFTMEVDIKNKGLAYLLSEGEAKPGCSIKGKLYNKLTPSEMLTTAREIEEYCKYVAVPVWLNGVQISKDLSSEKWTKVDEDAHYLLQANRNWLEVYNLGVLVRKYHASQFGMGGLVVSRKQLNVNFARNDILVSECQVWKRISSVIKAHAREHEGAGPKKVNNEHTRAVQVIRLFDNDFQSDKDMCDFLETATFFTDISGKHWTFSQLSSGLSRFNRKITVTPEPGNRIADKLQQGRFALVLDSSTLNRFSLYSLPEILARIRKCISGYNERVSRLPLHVLSQMEKGYVAFSDISSEVSETVTPVQDNKLTKSEKQVLSAIAESQHSFIYGLRELGIENIRTLRVMESDHIHMCTDGASFIQINRELLNIEGRTGAALEQFTKIGSILIHEYMHTESDADTHTHGSEFYQQVERMFCHHSECLGKFINKALSRWLAQVEKENKRLRAGELKELDRQAKLNQDQLAA